MSEKPRSDEPAGRPLPFMDAMGAEPPDRLARDLASLVPSEAPVSRELDDAVLAAARAALVPPVAPPWWRRPLILVPLASAAVLLVVAGTAFLGRPRSPDPRTADGHSLDVDASGRVDILDARALALLVRAGEADPARHDFDGDATVDGGDVELVARAAVKVGS